MQTVYMKSFFLQNFIFESVFVIGVII